MKWLASVLLLAAGVAAAQVPAPVATILKRAAIPAEAVAIVVQPVDGGRPLVAHNVAEPMNPASTMKVVTAYAALDLLGPAYTFKTDVLATGTLGTGGVLDGDLVIRGGGDPHLMLGDLWALVHRLRARGVREIRGDLVLDRTRYTPAAHDPARFDNDPRRAYNVGADALLVNFQVVDLTIVPDGQSARVFAFPDLPNLEVQSRIAITQEPCGSWRRGLKHEVTDNGLLATVLLSGTYPSACGEKTWPLALIDGPRFTESSLRWLWSEAGGVLRGKVRAAATPTDARLLLRHESPPLADLVRDMNKHSNNVMARHLFLELSSTKGAAGSEARSAAVLRDWLAQRRIEAPGFVVENGSGLSRAERITAGTMAAVLAHAWRSALMPELVSSFPVYGVDGTLRNRTATTAAGEAHLKGGTLNNVQSVAGVVVDRKGRRWIAVMIVNHDRAGAAQPALDALVEWVHQQG